MHIGFPIFILVTLLLICENPRAADFVDEPIKPCKVPRIQNGYITRVQRGTSVLAQAGSAINPGTIVRLHCNTSFIIAPGGSNQSYCLNTGDWLNPFAHCQAPQANFDDCGVINVAESRVLGGSFVKPGQLPWMVRLNITFQDSSDIYQCGAAVVAVDWLLTAAHCLTAGGDKIDSIVASFGRVNYTVKSMDTSDELIRRTNIYTVHPDYDESNDLNNDFGLIKFSPPVTFSNFIRKICLPDELCDDTSGQSRTATVIDSCSDVSAAGWGITENGRSFSRVLKKVSVTITSRERCSQQLRGRTNITDSKFCAGRDVANQDTCGGDSGGPLMCVQSGKTFAVGIVSYGYGCGIANVPGVYSRVCRALPWIKPILASGQIPMTSTLTPPTSEEPLKCYVPEIENGKYLLNGGTILPNMALDVGTVILLSCNDGFSRSSSVDNITCSETRLWLPLSSAQCVKQTICGAPQAVPHGRIAPGDSKVGVLRDIICNPGYTIRGRRRIACRSNGTWSLPGDCVKANCDAPPAVQNGYVTNGSTIVGATRRIICNDGFTVSDSGIITCQEDGLWSAPGTCAEIDCDTSTLPTIDNGYIENGNEGAGVGATKSIRCNAGYELHGESVITCNAPGIWGMPSSDCVQLGCGPLPIIEHGFVGNGSSLVGSSRNIRCNDGYSITPGTVNRIYCQDSGDWTDPGTCSQITCQNQLPSVANGYFETNGSSTVGSKRALKCNHGFKVAGIGVITCQSVGQWSQPAGQCLRQARTEGTESTNNACYGFTCRRNNKCILTTAVCNGINDCGDYSDEVNCPYSGKPKPELTIVEQYQLQLGQAAASGNFTGVKLILRLSVTMAININWRDPNNYSDCAFSSVQNGTALHRALQCNQKLPMVALLVDSGADVNIQEASHGYTPLHYAAFYNNLNIITRLLDKGANIDGTSATGATPLLLAATFGRVDAVGLLLNRGSDSSIKDKDGWTALTAAAFHGYRDVVTVLLDNSNNPNEINSLTFQNPSTALSIASKAWWAGHSAVMLAARNNKTETVRLLLSRGASPDGCTYVLCKVSP